MDTLEEWKESENQKELEQDIEVEPGPVVVEVDIPSDQEQGMKETFEQSLTVFDDIFYCNVSPVLLKK